MKSFLLFLLLIQIIACNNSADVKPVVKSDTTASKTNASLKYIHTFHDSLLADNITAALLKLPFVIRSNNYIDSFSNHKHHIAFMMNEPAPGETEIDVQAGFNGEERFETYYRFFVNPKTMEIKVYDPAEDKKLSVEAFLKSRP